MESPIIITETDEYFVINKPAGMAVEKPSPQKTLGEWLVENKQINPNDWQDDQRLGVVHRLDSDTSGILLWAKTPQAQGELKTTWQGRQVQKTYLALVSGETEKSGEIDLPLSRDNKNDKQQVDWLKTDRSRPALTQYERLEVGECLGQKVSLVKVHPITGRTHQIRVHLKAIGHPIIGDSLYGEKISRELAEKLELKRQFLHAWKLQLPDTEEYCATLPADLVNVLNALNIRSEH